jgi:hypothetical protein
MVFTDLMRDLNVLLPQGEKKHCNKDFLSSTSPVQVWLNFVSAVGSV